MRVTKTALICVVANIVFSACLQEIISAPDLRLEINVEGRDSSVLFVLPGGSQSEEESLDLRAFEFCAAHDFPAQLCAKMKQELAGFAARAGRTRLLSPFQAQGAISITEPACHGGVGCVPRVFPTARVHLNISLARHMSTERLQDWQELCYYLDHVKMQCRNASYFSTTQTYLRRPSFARKELERGRFHLLHVVPKGAPLESFLASRWFYVAAPKVKVTEASWSATTQTLAVTYYAADFRVGTDGRACLLVDARVRVCTRGRASSAPGGDDDSWGETEHHFSSTAELTKPAFVSVVLVSAVHDMRAVALSAEVVVVAMHTPRSGVGGGNSLPSEGAQEDVALSLLPAEFGLWSQNGEDGALLWLLSELGILRDPQVSFAVEFGAEDGWECNSRLLRERYEWLTLLMDGSHANKSINLRKEFIEARAINDLFAKYGVPRLFGLLSIDIDYNDIYVWEAIDDERYRPGVVVIEFNAHIPPPLSLAVPHKPQKVWEDGVFFGASLVAMARLGARKGYQLVHVDSHGVNAFFVRAELVARSAAVGLLVEPTADAAASRHWRPPNFFGRAVSYGDWEQEQGWVEWK